MGTGTHLGVHGTAMRRVRLVAILVVLATGIVALAIGLSRSNAGQAPAPTAIPATSAFAGIGQDGITLGSPDAPATLVEYADVQCPFCAVYAKTVLPTVVDRYVRTGRVKLELHVLAFLGQDSVRAARALAAAAQQERFWELSEQLFARQGAENSGWVTDELLRDAMAQTAGLDVERAWIATGSPAAARVLARAERSARRDRIAGTPAFLLRAGGATKRIEPAQLTAAGFTAALDAALAAR
jgi:protein-disulfide isomerase